MICRRYADGEGAAAIYRLLDSDKLNGHNPKAFIGAMLERIADHPIEPIYELLPSNLQAAHTNALIGNDECPNSRRRP